ncbi:DUF3606 domain-containing protein [bacterium]|nr:DUF3606 domain-containing protein [bacterium]
MPDDLTRRKLEDPKRISVHQKWAIEYWAKKFGVTELEILTAVAKVGPIVADVKRFLRV